MDSGLQPMPDGGPKPEAAPVGDARPEAGPVSEVGSIDSPAYPASCDDNNPCTADSCDITTYRCLNVSLPDGTSCQGTPCTTNSVCGGGLCLDGPFKMCTAIDQCHVAGRCDPKTGECSNPAQTNGTACNDGDKCTYGDTCRNGACAGDQLMCPHQTVCDPVSGSCPNGGFPNALSGWAFGNVKWPTYGSGLVRDAAGHIFAGGAFFDETDLGAGAFKVAGTTQTGQSYTNIFLAQIDPSTTKAAWMQSYPGPGSQNQTVNSFAVNGSGQIGVVGSLGGGSLTVAGDEVLQVRSGDQFILVANAPDGSGVSGWRLNLQNGDTNSNRGILRAIAGDPIGNSFMVCGNAVCGTGTIVADSGVPPSPSKDFSPSLDCMGGTDVILARIELRSAGVDGGSSAITLRGATKWATQVGGTNDEDCAALAMDSESSTYVLGTYRFGSTLSFGQTTLPMVGRTADTRLFLAKLSSNNEWLWAKDIGSDNQTVQPDAMIAVGTDVVIAGRISGASHSVLGSDLPSPAFVAKLSGSTGDLVWIQESLDVGFAQESAGVQVSRMTDAGGNILIAGNYVAAYTLATTPMPKPSIAQAAFVAQLAGSSGAILAARGYGDPEVGNESLAVGIVGRTDAVGSEADSSLLLLNFAGQLNFGAPVGVLQLSVGAATWGSSLTRHAP
jgi:hypothetical protein